MRRQGGFPPCTHNAHVTISVFPFIVLAGLPLPLIILSSIFAVSITSIHRRLNISRRPEDDPGTTRPMTASAPVDSQPSLVNHAIIDGANESPGNYRPGNRNAVAVDASRHHLLTLLAPRMRQLSTSLSEFIRIGDSLFMPRYSLVYLDAIGAMDRSDKAQTCVRIDRVG